MEEQNRKSIVGLGSEEIGKRANSVLCSVITFDDETKVTEFAKHTTKNHGFSSYTAKINGKLCLLLTGYSMEDPFFGKAKEQFKNEAELREIVDQGTKGYLEAHPETKAQHKVEVIDRSTFEDKDTTVYLCGQPEERDKDIAGNVQYLEPGMGLIMERVLSTKAPLKPYEGAMFQ